MAVKEMTITEALAELRTLRRRIKTKEEFIGNNAGRHSMMLDPHAEEGGSVKLVAEAMQARDDLAERIVSIRTSIQDSNLKVRLTVCGVERSLAEWLAWKREIESGQIGFLRGVSNSISRTRTKIRDEAPDDPNVKHDLTVHLNEKELADAIEMHEEIMGTLDGQLTLSNSTHTITV